MTKVHDPWLQAFADNERLRMNLMNELLSTEDDFNVRVLVKGIEAVGS